MADTKEYYQNLYDEYKALKKRTVIQAHDVKNGTIKVQKVFVEDMERKIEVQKELIKGFDFLSDNQLIELSGDYFFSKKAQDILKKRRESE